MDPRKTIVIADFDEVVRSVTDAIERDSGVRALGAAVEPTSITQLSQPVACPVEPRANQPAPSVIVGRTVVMGEVPRNISGSVASMSKTHVWRRELSVSEAEEDARTRTRVSVDESVIQHLSAELWAGQAPQGSGMLVTTVRQSIVDVQTTFLQTRHSELPATVVIPADEVARANEAVARLEHTVKTEVVAKSLARVASGTIRIPRYFQLPPAKTIRIACLALCMLSLGALVLSGRFNLHKPGSPASSAAARTVATVAALSGGLTQPVAVESTWRPAHAPQPTASAPTVRDAPAASSHATTLTPAPSKHATPGNPGPNKTAVVSAESPRAALDALIAGKQDLALARYRALAKNHPSEPAYETTARILEEANRRGRDAP
jgi:hypothetical protein